MTTDYIDDLTDALDETVCPHGIGLDDICEICDAPITLIGEIKEDDD